MSRDLNLDQGALNINHVHKESFLGMYGIRPILLFFPTSCYFNTKPIRTGVLIGRGRDLVCACTDGKGHAKIQ